jgi:AraC-like DNA-binding protein
VADRPVAIEFVRLFVAHLRAIDVDPAPIALETGVLTRRGERAEPTVRHPVARAFCERAAEVARDPFLGVHVAAQRPRGSFGVVEFGMRASADIRGALAFLVRFAPLLRDATVTYSEGDRREVRVGFAVPGDPSGLGRQAHEYRVAALAALFRDLAGDAAEGLVTRAWLSHAAPQRTELLERAMAPRLRFGCGDNGLALATARLDVPLRTADAPLLAYLEQQATGALADAREMVVPTYIRNRLREMLRDGAPSLEALARALRMSPRTLQRRFQAGGASYQAFLDETRRELALRELEQTDAEVEAVGALCGFASARSFIRAFRRWTGKTPTAYRRRITAL